MPIGWEPGNNALKMEFGRGGWTWTCRFVVPNGARCRLRHTPAISLNETELSMQGKEAVSGTARFMERNGTGVQERTGVYSGLLSIPACFDDDDRTTGREIVAQLSALVTVRTLWRPFDGVRLLPFCSSLSQEARQWALLVSRLISTSLCQPLRSANRS